MPSAAPAGFRENVTGLLVPEELSREREVWTRDEWRTLERAMKLLERRQIHVFMRCNRPACQKTPMERLRNPDGGITLRCQHRDRVTLTKW